MRRSRRSRKSRRRRRGRRRRRRRRRRSRKWRRLRRRRGGGASLDCEYCNRRAYCSTREGDTHTDSERERK